MISLLLDNPSDANQRIDKFLKKYLKEAPLGGIYKWLRTGKIKVNRKKVDQNYRTELGDIIELHFPTLELAKIQGRPPEILKEKDRDTTQKLNIIYEDEYFMVINKAPGINVHPGDHKTKEVSLIEIVNDYLGERYRSLSFRPALVHRIDRDTSGAIMVAKDKSTLEELLQLLQSGKIEKTYHTIVVGAPEKSRYTIRAKLLRREDAKNEAKVILHTEGQEAITHYETIQKNIHKKYSLLTIRIETGRTHQIRVHMASIGCPVLGDKAYGNSGENSFAKRTYGIERQLLHAYSLMFIHPKTKKKIEIIAPYHEDMVSLIGESMRK